MGMLKNTISQVELRKDVKNGRRQAVDDPGESRTVQTDKDRSDIRVILEKARRTGGVVGYITAKQAAFADVSSVPDYMTALNVVARANEAFSLLPADIRDRFSNDPARFLAFMENKENEEEIYKLGLRPRPPVKEEPRPVEVRVVNPEGTPPKSS